MKILEKLKKIFIGNSDKWLMLGTLIGLVILIFTQVMLIMVKKDEEVFFPDSALEGLPLAEDQYLYNQGIIQLTAENTNEEDCIIIYLNGSRKSIITSKPVNVTVKEHDVIELVGRPVAKPVKVSVTSVSGKIDKSIKGQSIMVDTKLRRMLRVEGPLE